MRFACLVALDPVFARRAPAYVALSPLRALDELCGVGVSEVELSLLSVFRCTRIVLSAVVILRRRRSTVQFGFAVLSCVSMVTGADVSSDFVFTESVSAWIGSTVVFHAVAMCSNVPDVALAIVSVDVVLTCSVFTGTGSTFVDICLADWSCVSSFADTLVFVDAVFACSVKTRTRFAFVDICLAVVSGVSWFANTGVSVDLIAT